MTVPRKASKELQLRILWTPENTPDTREWVGWECLRYLGWRLGNWSGWMQRWWRSGPNRFHWSSSKFCGGWGANTCNPPPWWWGPGPSAAWSGWKTVWPLASPCGETENVGSCGFDRLIPTPWERLSITSRTAFPYPWLPVIPPNLYLFKKRAVEQTIFIASISRIFSWLRNLSMNTTYLALMCHPYPISSLLLSFIFLTRPTAAKAT